MRRPRRPTVLFVTAGILLAFGLIGTFFFAEDEEPTRLVTPDRLHDCRESGRDTGDRCDEGADIETVTLWLDGDRLVVELALTEVPPLGPDIKWTTQFFAELQSPVICGLTNAIDDSGPGATAIAYALHPVTRELLGPNACDGRLDGKTAVFTIDAGDQPAGDEFRVIGSVKLDFLDDPSQPGSEDDFLVRTSISVLRGDTSD